MERVFLAKACVLSWLCLLAAPVALAQTNDPFQRFIRFHNSLDRTIYPVIQAPQDAPPPDKPNDKPTNCGIGGHLRIIVNQGTEGAGIPKGGTVTVKLPKDSPCPHGGFYDATRVYILVANFDAFEPLLNAPQKTVRIPDWDYGKYSPCAGCWVGKSSSDYGHDAPGQLLEYTIDSQDPATGSRFDDPNNPNGTPLLDFDVSYVDDAHLPVAMAIDDGGATQFMGSTLKPADFDARLTQFLTDGNWSRYAAYSPRNWATPEECTTPGGRPTNIGKTSFSCLTPRTDRVPSANIIITDAQTGGTSAFFLPQWDGTTPKQCNAPGSGADPTSNLKCSTPRPDGDGLDTPGQLCCPDPNNFMQGCCDLERFLIDNTHRKFNVDVTPKVFKLSNDTLANLVGRFTRWQGVANDPCLDQASEAITTAPVVDKHGFCSGFKRTIDFVWKEFAPQCPRRGDAADRCVAAAIIGYNLKDSTFDPGQCTKCPSIVEGACPRQCALEAQRNESVQALQRGLPWTASGDPAQCGSCPNATSCSSSCILPVVVSPDAKLYHRDKFLHFWADYKSVYNLNPFARFVHNYEAGLAAPGAYSFSIDDFYGNFGGPGSTLIIDVGSDIQKNSILPNKEPFDPFKQYHAGLGTGWDHAKVCGRDYRLPRSAPSNVGLSTPLSFWDNGTQKTECEVRLYATADESNYIAFLLKELTFSVTDDYTAKRYSVQGLSGVYAVRFPDDSPPDNAYCVANSTDKDLVSKGFCRANLSSGTLNLAYVGVSDAGCVGKSDDGACGRPLVNLNVPSLK
ncbi:MAG: hypothetical protein ABWY12_15910 [Burkholderiales bacterium]